MVSYRRQTSDSQIRHPNTGEVSIGRGLIADPQYCNSTMSKMKKYISNGIIPVIHLITTYETQEYLLDSARVEEIIQMYFG